MKGLKLCVAVAVAAIGIAGSTRKATPQGNISIGVGVAPACPYGSFNCGAYSCASFGYYGPQWFTGGVFIGAGPWFHGSEGFHGYVDHHFDPRFGYGGPFPHRGDRPDWGRHVAW